MKVLSLKYQQCLLHVSTLTAEGGFKTGPFRHLSSHVFQSQRFLKYLSYEAQFFSKNPKFYGDFRNAMKFPQKVFGFLDNSIRIGCGKVFVLSRKNLSSVINVLTNRPKIWDFTKREFLQLILYQTKEKIG